MYFPIIKDIRPTAKIEDLHLLKEIAGKCGYKIRIVAQPNAEEKQELVSTHNFAFHNTSNQAFDSIDKLRIEIFMHGHRHHQKI